MQKVTLEINNSIYDYIIFFLENIPKNLVNIKQDRLSHFKSEWCRVSLFEKWILKAYPLKFGLD